MVPMAPSATMTRRDNCSRNSWARFGVFMGNGSQGPFRHGRCDISDSSSKAQAREQPGLDGEALQHPQTGSGFESAEDQALDVRRQAQAYGRIEIAARTNAGADAANVLFSAGRNIHGEKGFAVALPAHPVNQLSIGGEDVSVRVMVPERPGAAAIGCIEVLALDRKS